MTVVTAMGQMFYSLSIAMGILYTYGSYIGKDVDIEKSTSRVEIFDTGIAMLAGLMIIPAVFAFSGGDMNTLQAGPSLTFITLPKVFDSMGVGTVVGIAFPDVPGSGADQCDPLFWETTRSSTLNDELHGAAPNARLLMVAVMLTIGTLLLPGIRDLGMRYGFLACRFWISLIS